MYKNIVAPIQVQWEVTAACNHKCVYCYNFFREEKNINILPDNYVSLFSSVVDQIIDNKVFSVVITGGEPLLVFEKIYSFVKKLSQNKVSISMNTNLTLLTEKLGNMILDSGINSFLFSIPTCYEEKFDFLTSKKGSFRRLISAIKVAQKLGFRLYPNMVVSKYNYDDIEETAKFCKSMNINYFAATKVSKPISNDLFNEYLLTLKEFREMRMLLDKISSKFKMTVDSLQANPICSFGKYKPISGHRNCSAGRTSITIGPEGEVRPCIMYPVNYGNIREGLVKCWKSLEVMRSDAIIPEECKDCKIKASCLGGCKADAFIVHGKLNAKDPMCDPEYTVDYPMKQIIEKIEKNEFIVNPRICYRKEGFGGTVFVNNSNFVFLKKKLYERIINGNNNITIYEIADILEINDKSASDVASYLFSRKVLL